LTPNTSATKKRFGFLILFALPFTAVGVGAGVWLFSGILEHWKMRSWEERPATIVRAELETHRGRKGGATYRATAEYTYHYQGRQYTGNRVSINGGRDNVGSFHQDVHRQLSEHQKSSSPFRCYVNSERPAEAILFRDLRWSMVGFQMIFATVFGAAGFGMLTFSVLGYRKTKGDSALVALHPDEPWLCKKDWADGKISSSAKTAAIVLLVCTFFWNLISVPALLVFRYEAFAKGNRLVFLILVFPVIGAILVLCTIVSMLRWRKYGQSVFEMASMPGVIGGQLAGVIRTSAKVQPEDGFRLTLNCVQRVTTQRGKNSSTSESVLWQDEQLIARDFLQNDPARSAIPVLFRIPYDCRPTDKTNANDQTIWRLEVSAKTSGLDYSTTFDVPVFKTIESDPNFVVDQSLIAEYAAPENLDRDLHEAGVVKMESLTGEGCRLVFPMARAPGVAFFLTVFGLVFFAVPFVMFYMGAEWWINTIFGAVFGLVGLLCLAFSASAWFYSSAVDASPHGLTIVGGLFGLGREQRIGASDVKNIVLTSRAGQGEKVYYDIDIVCLAGKTVTASKRILGKRLASSVIRQIEQAMGQQQDTAKK